MDLDETTLEAKVVKGGETAAQVTFYRSQKGLSIAVKAHPMLEEFIKSMGDGDQVDVRTLGSRWIPIPKDTNLMVYTLSEQSRLSLAHQNFSLNHPGTHILNFAKQQAPLDDGDGRIFTGNVGNRYGPNINISFLRLVGISEGPGVQFGLSGVYTLDAVRNMRDLTIDAMRNFYQAYMKPVNMTVTMTIQEIAP